jgi:hypothetical protein
MAIRQTKKISELNTLTSASLNTYVLGVDNGSTYKITLDVLEDAVVNMVSRSTDLRLDALESYTSSANAASDISALNSYTSSQTTLNTAFTNGINARLQTSSFNEFSASVHNEILAATNEQDLTPYVTELVYNVLSSSVDDRIDNLEANSGSYLTSLNGAISSSSQLTSSYDSRYVISGSITQTTWDNIANKPSGIVSQSTDLSSLNTFTQSIDNRVDSLESWSSSLDSTFATDLQVSIVSSSVAATIGVISQNTGLVSTSSFNEYTASQSTGSLVNRLNAIENVSGSWITESETGSFLTNLNGAISSSSQLTSSFDARYTISGSVGATPLGTISGSAQITAFGFISSSDSTTALNSYTASLKNAIELTGSTVSFLGNIVIYGTQSVINSQNVEISDNILYLSPTASTDNDLGIVGHYNDGTYRHAGIFMDASDEHSWKVFNGLQTETTATVDTNGTGFALAPFKAGVITATSFNGIINATNGVISGSSQLPAGLVSGSSQILGGSGVVSGSYETTGRGIISSSANLVTTSSFNSYTASISTASLVTSINNLNTYTASVSTASLVTSIAQLNTFTASVSTASLVTSIIQLNTYTASVSTASLVTSINNLNTFTASQSTASLVTSITNLNTETASLESRLATIGTQSGSWGGAASLTSLNTFSASINSYTTSAESKFTSIATITGSLILSASADASKFTTLGTYTSSLNTWTSSIATTGSNSFNGAQNITGSLTVSSIATISSSFTANSSSLTLNSGSNLYVQNNGIVEITGSLKVSGSTNLIVNNLLIGTGSGDEGGEINLAKAVTNTTLTGSGITIDSYRDRLRIFEQGGDARGVYIDLAKTPGGVAGELMWKASGIVNAGTFVTLDNIKAQVPASGNKGLSLATVSGTVTGYISGHYQGILSSSSGTSSTTSLSTTATSSMFSWNFGQQGDMSTYILRDDTNNRVYRIILIIGAAYNNNFISIERLY